MQRLAEFLIGLLFGLGLLVSGMSNPAKVLAFLDLAGAWDPSLAFVMAGAVAVAFVAFRLAGRRAEAVFGGAMQIPTASRVDRRLLVGALIFGVGWGLAGFCPGPGLVAMASGQAKGAAFVVAMLAGMLIYEKLNRPRA